MGTGRPPATDPNPAAIPAPIPRDPIKLRAWRRGHYLDLWRWGSLADYHFPARWRGCGSCDYRRSTRGRARLRHIDDTSFDTPGAEEKSRAQSAQR